MKVNQAVKTNQQKQNKNKQNKAKQTKQNKQKTNKQTKNTTKPQPAAVVVVTKIKFQKCGDMLFETTCSGEKQLLNRKQLRREKSEFILLIKWMWKEITSYVISLP